MADINEIFDRLEAALDKETGIVLTIDEVDELLWSFGEQGLAIELQLHMIVIQAERPDVTKH